MSLQDDTKLFIDRAVRRFYYKAIEFGATVTPVEYVGANMYKLNVGKLELTYMGKVDGTAEVIGASGDVF